MPTIFTNSYLTTARSSRNQSSGISGPAATNLTNQPAMFAPFTPRSGRATWLNLPEDVVLASDYEAHVASGTDIQQGDYISNVLLKDKKTGWPDLSAADTLHVIYTQESPPPFIPTRYIFIQRVRTGGLPK